MDAMEEVLNRVLAEMVAEGEALTRTVIEIGRKSLTVTPRE